MRTQRVVPRRGWIAGLAAGGALSFWTGVARSGAAKAVTLSELVYYSQHIVVGTAREATSAWERVGGSRRLVTYSRLDVHQPLDGRDPPRAALYVRTLGGQVGDIGQIVFGEATLSHDEPCVVFLREIEPALFSVSAMAQGHYPLRRDDAGIERLQPSPRLPHLLRASNQSAVERLRGRSLTSCEHLVAEVQHRAR